MADITMCNPNKCTLKETCYRYKATANKYRQSYFTEEPFKDGECSEYWKQDKLKGEKDRGINLKL